MTSEQVNRYFDALERLPVDIQCFKLRVMVIRRVSDVLTSRRFVEWSVRNYGYVMTYRNGQSFLL